MKSIRANSLQIWANGPCFLRCSILRKFNPTAQSFQGTTPLAYKYPFTLNALSMPICRESLSTQNIKFIAFFFILCPGVEFIASYLHSSLVSLHSFCSFHSSFGLCKFITSFIAFLSFNTFIYCFFIAFFTFALSICFIYCLLALQYCFTSFIALQSSSQFHLLLSPLFTSCP